MPKPLTPMGDDRHRLHLESPRELELWWAAYLACITGAGIQILRQTEDIRVESALRMADRSVMEYRKRAEMTVRKALEMERIMEL